MASRVVVAAFAVAALLVGVGEAGAEPPLLLDQDLHYRETVTADFVKDGDSYGEAFDCLTGEVSYSTGLLYLSGLCAQYPPSGVPQVLFTFGLLPLGPGTCAERRLPTRDAAVVLTGYPSEAEFVGAQGYTDSGDPIYWYGTVRCIDGIGNDFRSAIVRLPNNEPFEITFEVYATFEEALDSSE